MILPHGLLPLGEDHELKLDGFARELLCIKVYRPFARLVLCHGKGLGGVPLAQWGDVAHESETLSVA